MKFLCSNCKAKYQIPNEKVAGRTLRMTCRRCGEEILIRGQFLGGSESGATPPPGGGSALGAGFRKQAPAPPPPPAASAQQWHVAIQDSPVGPLRREDVAARIADGSLDGESLAWRDGMEDWQPVREIPELARLLSGRPSAAAPPPPPSSPGFPSPTAEPTPQPSPPAAPLPPPASAPVPPTASAPAPAPAGFAAHEPSSPASLPDFEETRRGGRQRGPSWGMMFMMVAGGAFIMMVGIVLGVQLSSSPKDTEGPSEPAAAAEKHDEPSADSEQTATPEVELELDDMQPEPQDEAKAEDAREAESERARRARSRGTGRRKEKQLSAEERDMLARMGGRSGAANIESDGEREGSGSGRGGTGLSAAQLRKVVTKGRPSLQRCYETALRGTPSNETIRMDIQITIGTSGKVTRVNARGQGLPGLDRCLERIVRRWVFPSAGDTTRTSFPVVFQPGG